MTAGPYDCVARVVAQTDASAMTLPTDRSMPPPMITTVTPTVITPMIEAEVRIVSRLLVVANVSAVARPMTHSTRRTATSPRLRPALVSRTRARADGRSACAAARSTRPRSAAGGTVTACESPFVTALPPAVDLP